jgi:hypothetical protein
MKTVALLDLFSSLAGFMFLGILHQFEQCCTGACKQIPEALLFNALHGLEL